MRQQRQKPQPVKPHPSIPITKCRPGAHGPNWTPNYDEATAYKALARLKVADFKPKQ